MKKSIRLLERVMGRQLDMAKSMSEEILEDFNNVVTYPKN